MSPKLIPISLSFAILTVTSIFGPAFAGPVEFEHREADKRIEDARGADDAAHAVSEADLERIGRGDAAPTPEPVKKPLTAERIRAILDDPKVQAEVEKAMENLKLTSSWSAPEEPAKPVAPAAPQPAPQILYKTHMSVGGVWKGPARRFIERRKFNSDPALKIETLDTSTWLSGVFDIKLAGPAPVVRKWIIDFWRDWLAPRTHDNWMDYDRSMDSVEREIEAFDKKYPDPAAPRFHDLWPVPTAI